MDRPLDTQAVLVPKPAVCARRVGDEMVLLDPETGIYYGLNAVGAGIWELLGTRISLEEVVSALTRDYDVLSEDCCRDVLRIAGELVERGLAVALEPPAR